MLVGSRALGPWLVLALAWAGCARTTTEVTASPEPAPVSVTALEAEAEQELPFEKHTYISTSHNEAGDREHDEAGPVAADDAPAEAFVVTTADEARARAEAAVTERLDAGKTWKLSPVMPSAWPAEHRDVVVFFYPMSANAGSLTEYQVYSAAFRVTVSLVDGTAEVEPLGKRRKLGTVKETRPSSLERREVEMSESALLRQMMGVSPESGTKPYWGYLKYVHEHPKVGADLERRAPEFFRWLRRKHGH